MCFNMLLQVMEEGRLTGSFGRNVDFRNTIHHHDDQRWCGGHQERVSLRVSRSRTMMRRTTA